MPNWVTDPGKYLETLALRCTPDLIGNTAIYLREFEQETMALWWKLDKAVKQRTGRDAQPPYSVVTAVLRAMTGGFVNFYPGRGFLASLHPIRPALLERAFTILEGIVRGIPIESIDLSQPPSLATAIAGTQEQQRMLADEFVANEQGQPTLAPWVYETVAWDLSRRLAASPFEHANGHTVVLRPDVDGRLIALDDPWTSEDGQGYAISRTTLRLKTLPNISVPVVLFDAGVTRISNTLVFAKTVIGDQGSDKPLLNVALDGRARVKSVSMLALQALSRLSMNNTVLHAMATRLEAERKILAEHQKGEPLEFPGGRPTVIWPVAAKNSRYLSSNFGVGVGMEHQRRLHAHMLQTFGERAERLAMRELPVRFAQRPHEPTSARLESRPQTPERAEELAGIKARIIPTPEAVAASVRELGFDRLRITCLWYSDEVRQRMLATLNRAFNIDLKDSTPDVEIPLAGDKVTATFVEAPELLRHGPTSLKPAIMTVLPESGDGELLVAWCETETPAAKADPDEDAKTQTRVMFAKAGVPNQYLTPLTKKRNKRKTAGFDDFQAQSALLDLFRSVGIVDDRITKALATKGDDSRVAKMAHVGIRVRKQSRRPGEKGSPKYVVTAAALVPPRGPTRPWSMWGWSLTRPTWHPYHRAQSVFHASEYPPASGFQTDQDQWSQVRRLVDQALEDLADDLDGVAYSVSVDGVEARRIWPGLQNVSVGATPDIALADGWLPGASLGGDSRPSAVIRINTDGQELPRPTEVTKVSAADLTRMNVGEEVNLPRNATARGLYELATEFGSPSWYLCSVPVQFDGGQRYGESYTRWSAAGDRVDEMRQNWYSMTTVEILPVMNTSGLKGADLAAGTARLCHQALYWGNRSKYPVPLHAAAQMDRDHPQYRRTIAPEGDAPDDAEDEPQETLS